MKASDIEPTCSDTVLTGDALTELRWLPPESVHLTFTSPPYFNARSYSQWSTYEDYLDFLQAVFKQVGRVTKEGRFLVVNSSPVMTPREKRQDQSRRHGIPYDLHGRITREGWDFVDDIVWVKPEPSVPNRIAGFAQHGKPLAYKPNIQTEMVMVYRRATDNLIDWNMKQYPDDVVSLSRVTRDYPRGNVWEISPVHDSCHPAVFPEKLAERVIRLYSFRGDTVLDPFAGSGTVGVAAIKQRRGCILIERDAAYAEYARQRLKKAEETGICAYTLADPDAQCRCPAFGFASGEHMNSLQLLPEVQQT